MSTENVGNLNFSSLFSQNMRFEIPFFQRGYAWEKKQWDQLFNDINEQVISEAEDLAEVESNEHFFGPVVVLEQTNSDPLLRRFLVIDGQQRITTVYLLLAMIKKEIETKVHESQEAGDYVVELTKLLVNQHSGDDDYKKLKVFSSKGDRLPTYKTIFDTNPNSPILAADIQLYNPETNNIDKFRHYAAKRLGKEFKSVPELWKLCTALLKSLKIVWIPLKEGKDDPQAIFESLNDRGMPLTAAELLCNYIFRPLIAAKENFEDLHNNRWLKTQKAVEGDHGFEEYLRLLFSIGEKKVIGKGRKLYTFYKSKNSNISVKEAKQAIEEISDNVASYNLIVNPFIHRHAHPALNELVIKINNTRMEACYTFVLSVLKSIRTQALSPEKGIDLLRETLVLLVRRKYGELSTTKYDTIFPGLLKKVISEPDHKLAINDAFKENSYWVSDQEFSDFILNRPLYRERDLPFTRMILQEVDRSLSTYGQLPDYSTLKTVEHIMPQTIDDHWKSYIADDSTNPDLDRYINTIGNLCLLSGPANSHAGQDPFESKKADYPDVTALARDVKKRNVKWNIEAIKNRSKDLKEALMKLYSWGA